MNKPCEHCNKANKEKTGYFKCDNPCGQAKACYESDKRAAELLLKNPFYNEIKKGRV